MGNFPFVLKFNDNHNINVTASFFPFEYYSPLPHLYEYCKNSFRFPDSFSSLLEAGVNLQYYENYLTSSFRLQFLNIIRKFLDSVPFKFSPASFDPKKIIISFYVSNVKHKRRLKQKKRSLGSQNLTGCLRQAELASGH
jgi:hypothetical protein